MKLDEYKFTHDSPLSLDYHLFGAEWLPDRIIFYFDNEPIYYCDCSHKFQHLMNMRNQYVVIDLQLDGRANNSFYPEASNGFPFSMRVDYFRYYKLRTKPGQSLRVNDYLSFMRIMDVYDSITVSNVVMNNSGKKILRANGIVIENDFEVPIGAELFIIPTPCVE